MTTEEDRANLARMLELANSIQSGESIARAARELPLLADLLSFSDNSWYDELFEHIVTLDSASTYEPDSESNARAAETATLKAAKAMRDMLSKKLASDS